MASNPVVTQGRYGNITRIGGGTVYADPRDNPNYNQNTGIATPAPAPVSLANRPITPSALSGNPIPYSLPTPTPYNNSSLSASNNQSAAQTQTTADQPIPPPNTMKDTTQSFLQKYLGDMGKQAQDITDIRNTEGLYTKQAKAKELATNLDTMDKNFRDEVKAIRENKQGLFGGAVEQAVSNAQSVYEDKRANAALSYKVAAEDYNGAAQIVNDKIQALKDQNANELNAYKLVIDAVQHDLTDSERLQVESNIRQKEKQNEVFTSAYSDAVQAGLDNGAGQGYFNALDAAKTSGDVSKIAGLTTQYGYKTLDQQYKQQQINKLRNEAVTAANANSEQANLSIDNDVRAILEGRNTAFNIRQTMGRTNAAAAYMQKVRDKINGIDPNFDFVASDAGGKSVSSGYVQKATAAINSVLPNIDHIIQLSDQVSRFGVKSLDDVLQRTKAQFGNQSVSSFREAQKLIADEIGVALGAGTVSDMKLQLGFDVTDPTVSQDVFASNMGIVKSFIINRLAGLNSLRYSSSTVNGVTLPGGGAGIYNGITLPH